LAECAQVRQWLTAIQPRIAESDVEPLPAINVRNEMKVHKYVISFIQSRQQGYERALMLHGIDLPADTLLPYVDGANDQY